jgi:hypothetical protein
MKCNILLVPKHNFSTIIQNFKQCTLWSMTDYRNRVNLCLWGRRMKIMTNSKVQDLKSPGMWFCVIGVWKSHCLVASVCRHVQDQAAQEECQTMKMRSLCSFKMSEATYIHWHSIIFHKIKIFSNTTVRTSCLANAKVTSFLLHTHTLTILHKLPSNSLL